MEEEEEEEVMFGQCPAWPPPPCYLWTPAGRAGRTGGKQAGSDSRTFIVPCPAQGRKYVSQRALPHTGSNCVTSSYKEHKIKFTEFCPTKWRTLSIFLTSSVAFAADIIL